MNYKGQLEGFPVEIVEKMLERQVEQGNKRDISVFEKNVLAGGKRGEGFTWDKTPEGHNFWLHVISRRNFEVFFDRYPKKELTFPRKMLVWVEDKKYAEIDLVLGIFPERDCPYKVIGEKNIWTNAEEMPVKSQRDIELEKLESQIEELKRQAQRLREI